MRPTHSWAVRLLAILVLAGCASIARADGFDFSFTGPGISGSGALEVSPVLGTPNEYFITGGDINGAPLVLVPYGVGVGDNFVFSSAPYLDMSGFAFLANGTGLPGSGAGYQENIFYLDGQYYFESCLSLGINCTDTQLTSFQLSPILPISTPEPSSLVLMILGLFALAPFLRRVAPFRTSSPH